MARVFGCVGHYLYHLGRGSNGYTDTDIKFNGDDHTWFTDTGGDRSGTDVISVAAHEVGHAIGLDHSDVPTAMAPSTQSGDRSGRTLERDDMEGMRTLSLWRRGA